MVAQVQVMYKNNDYYTMLAGFLGLALGVLMTQPKKIPDAIVAFLGALFSGMVVAPATAEICSNIAASVGWLSWMRATPDTSIYTCIIGLHFLLGYQLVLFFRDDAIQLGKSFLRSKLKIKDDE